MRIRRVGVPLAAVAAGAGLLAACGDPVTAARTFYSVATVTAVVVDVPVAGGGTQRILHDIAAGPLVSDPDKQTVFPGTSFREDCSVPVTTTMPQAVGSSAPAPPQLNCVLTLYTGPKIYVAEGKTETGEAIFTGLGARGNTMTVKLAKPPTVPPPAASFLAAATAAGDAPAPAPRTVVLAITLRP
jgi:hypothetical protein